MPRSGSGTYTLPSGNPVVTGTTIESNWANTTLSDIATTLSDSLSRSGQGGMTAALRVADGTQGAPGVGFANETSTGLYRAGTGEMWAVVQGAQTLNLDANGVYVPADKTTTVDGAFVFNEAGADKDARFEGDTDANLLVTDASTDRVGVGTNAPATKLTVRGATQNKEVALRWERATDGAVAGGLGYFYDSENSLAVGSVTNHPFKIITNDATVATFDSSGNLGIGTSSPGARVTVAGGRLQVTGNTAPTSGTGIELFYDGTAAGALAFARGTGYIPLTVDGSDIRFNTSSTEKMRLDASGNLGLGVTPSAWQAGAKAVEIGGNGYLAFTGNAVGGYLYSNAYFTGTNTYKANGFAAAYGLGVSGQHIWYTAPSGTAGNAISFTQAMTLDASGNLGLGVTPVAYTANARTFQLDGGANSAQIRLTNNTTGTAQTNGGLLSMDGNQLSVWNVENDALRFGTNDTERARITSGGDLQSYGAVSIWPSSSGGAGSYSIKRAATNALAITDDFAGQERLRITSGGDLLVGTTSGTGRITSYSGGSAHALIAEANAYEAATFVNNTNSYYVQSNWSKATTGNNLFVDFGTEGTYTSRGYIDYNRAGGQVRYNTTSDYRLKTFVAKVTGSGQRIDALNPVEFEWKENGNRARGFFAHEFQQVYASSVSGEKDAVDAEGKPVYQAMQASTSEVIADLVAEIQSLRARVAALEAA